MFTSVLSCQLFSSPQNKGNTHGPYNKRPHTEARVYTKIYELNFYSLVWYPFFWLFLSSERKYLFRWAGDVYTQNIAQDCPNATWLLQHWGTRINMCGGFLLTTKSTHRESKFYLRRFLFSFNQNALWLHVQTRSSWGGPKYWSITCVLELRRRKVERSKLALEDRAYGNSLLSSSFSFYLLTYLRNSNLNILHVDNRYFP